MKRRRKREARLDKAQAQDHACGQAMGFALTALRADDSCLAILGRRRVMLLIARNIILPRAQALKALLLARGAFVIALEGPIRLSRPFRPTLAY
jgi:hypothetical protein